MRFQICLRALSSLSCISRIRRLERFILSVSCSSFSEDRWLKKQVGKSIIFTLSFEESWKKRITYTSVSIINGHCRIASGRSELFTTHITRATRCGNSSSLEMRRSSLIPSSSPSTRLCLGSFFSHFLSIAFKSCCRVRTSKGWRNIEASMWTSTTESFKERSENKLDR